MTKINFHKINELVDSGHISKRKHPTEDLYIYNYTKKTQYESYWCEETEICRGLIVDGNNNIVCRPFRKFFNIGQNNNIIPQGNFQVYEKMDGVLGILYWIKDTPYIATRGSFNSLFAIEASKMIQEFTWVYELDRNLTHLFEIIYPKARIICDYGDKRSLIYLASIDPKTGNDVKIKYPSGMEIVDIHNHLKNINSLSNENYKNREGFVIKWDNNYRLKYKFDEYKKLHKLLVSCTTIDIWLRLAIEDLKKYNFSIKEISYGLKVDINDAAFHYNKDNVFSDLYDHIPDEFFIDIKAYIKKINDKFDEVESNCLLFLLCNNSFDGMKKKDAAKCILSYKKECRPIIFNIINNKPYRYLIWSTVKPKSENIFRAGL